MSGLKIGMVGLDTSHCEAFTNILNNPEAAHHVPGGKVVNAFPGGSDLCAVSRDRVSDITRRMRDEKGINICDSLEVMAEGMDAFLLESVDGRQHAEQFAALAAFGKPIFVDKPFACTLADARAMRDLARGKDIPVMSASAIRYAKGSSNLCADDEKVMACETFGPMVLPDDYPQYFWYGIHSAETLFSYMGQGCKTVRVIHQKDSDLLIGEWADGRLGSVRGVRFEGIYFGCTVFTDKGVKRGESLSDPPYYALMMQDIIPFFQTGKSPIDLDETVEIIAFLEAATRSREEGGRPATV